MSDVVLVKLERCDKAHQIAPPFSLLYLGDSLEKAGFTVRLYNEQGTEANIQKLLELIHEENPVFIGFSCFTDLSLYHSKKASIEIKKKAGTPVIWGGIHPTILPEQTLKNEFIDIIAIGEGEETVVELAGFLKKKKSDHKELKNIKGIGFKRKGKVIINEPRPFIKNLDAYSPAWHLIDSEKYIYSGKNFYTQIGSKLSEERVTALYTSRGCPWRCGYCYNQAVNKRVFRSQTPEKTIKEILFWKRRNVSTVIFEDDNFFSDKNRVLDIIRNVDIKWSATIRANYIANWGEEFVKELSSNGCIELRIGAESGSQKILDIMKKDITVEQIREAVDLCSKYRIKTLLNFMVGIPGETWDDVKMTLDFMDELEKKSEFVSIGSPGVFVPWPGLDLSKRAEKNGFVPPDNLGGWARQWAQRSKLAPYNDKRIKFLGFYKSLIRRDLKDLSFPLFTEILRNIAVWRWEKRYFKYPVDYYIPHFILELLRKSGMKKLSDALFE